MEKEQVKTGITRWGKAQQKHSHCASGNPEYRHINILTPSTWASSIIHLCVAWLDMIIVLPASLGCWRGFQIIRLRKTTASRTFINEVLSPTFADHILAGSTGLLKLEQECIVGFICAICLNSLTRVSFRLWIATPNCLNCKKNAQRIESIKKTWTTITTDNYQYTHKARSTEQQECT